MSIPTLAIDAISKIAPALGTLLGGPIGGAAGAIVSSVMGSDIHNANEFCRHIQNDPMSAEKLKTLEIQLNDLESARREASTETGLIRYFRPVLAIFAFIALFADVLCIAFINNDAVKQILLVMMGILVFDIKQLYKFYFGSGEDVSAIFPFGRKI